MESAPFPIDPSPPVHVAIIMYGNGRWARARGLPRALGHKSGAEAVRRTVEAAREMGVSYLTLYAFSAENWKRPPAEIAALMGLLRLYLRSEIANLSKNGIRLRVIGDRGRMGADIVALVDEVEAKTRNNGAMTLTLALSYGGRQEIAEAARAAARDVAAGRISADEVDETTLARYLATADMPDPDLVIRTSGEKRVSNFLLWQSAYAELLFVDVLWPDFGRDDFEAAVRAYHHRERRYGAAIG